jgi:hypothetical protein
MTRSRIDIEKIKEAAQAKIDYDYDVYELYEVDPPRITLGIVNAVLYALGELQTEIPAKNNNKPPTKSRGPDKAPRKYTKRNKGVVTTSRIPSAEELEQLNPEDL